MLASAAYKWGLMGPFDPVGHHCVAVVVLLAFVVLLASKLSLLVVFLRLTRAYGLYGAVAFFLERVAPSLVVLVPPPGRLFSEYEKPAERTKSGELTINTIYLVIHLFTYRFETVSSAQLLLSSVHSKLRFGIPHRGHLFGDDLAVLVLDEVTLGEAGAGLVGLACEDVALGQARRDLLQIDGGSQALCPLGTGPCYILGLSA